MPKINSALSCPGRPWRPGTRDKKIRQTAFDYEGDGCLTAAMIKQAVNQFGKTKLENLVPIVHPDTWAALQEYDEYDSFDDLLG